MQKLSLWTYGSKSKKRGGSGGDGDGDGRTYEGVACRRLEGDGVLGIPLHSLSTPPARAARIKRSPGGVRNF